MDGAADIDAGDGRFGTEAAERVVFYMFRGGGRVADALAVSFVRYQFEGVVYRTFRTCIVNDPIVGHRPTDLARCTRVLDREIARSYGSLETEGTGCSTAPDL